MKVNSTAFSSEEFIDLHTGVDSSSLFFEGFIDTQIGVDYSSLFFQAFIDVQIRIDSSSEKYLYIYRQMSILRPFLSKGLSFLRTTVDSSTLLFE